MTMRLFISYSHEDKPWVETLWRAIREDTVHDAWIDRKILVGQDWWSTILDEIEASDAFVYVLTPDSADSVYCRAESSYALALNKPVIPLMLKPCAGPTVLSHLQYKSIRDGASMESVLLTVTNSLFEINEHRARYAPPRSRPVRPPAPQRAAAKVAVPPAAAPQSAAPKVAVADLLPPPFEWIEIPAGRVTLAPIYGTFDLAVFALAKYPITNAQFQVFVDAKDGYCNATWWRYSSEAFEWRNNTPQPMKTAFAGDDLPRTNVNWYTAVAFCYWLSARTGEPVMLPTEAQWQRAAQGDDGRTYPWGNTEPDETRCNFAKHVGQATPVTRYPKGASPYGVMDMSGNVWEWGLNLTDDPAGTAVTGGSLRVLRGGSFGFSYPSNYLRAANRDGRPPNEEFYLIGFRCARSAFR